MSNKLVKGIIAAMVTPFDENEHINETELRNQVNRQINAGVDGVFALGTNGEGYILSYAEKVQVMKIIVDETKHRVPVYAGTGCVSTTETITLSKEAKEIGVDVLSVITPSFAKASQEELYTHYKKLNDAVKMPIVLYNIPARTGNFLAPETVERLADLPNIVGVKDSSGNFDNILQYIEKTKEKDFSVLSGNDALILWTLQAGGTGGITAVANVLPEIMTAIYKCFVAGDWNGARTAQDSIRAIRNCLALGNPNSIIKKATNLIGYPVGNTRAPFNIISEDVEQKVLAVLKKNYIEYFNK